MRPNIIISNKFLQGEFVMFRTRVRIETITDVANFVLIASGISKPVRLTNGSGLVVDGKSFLGVAHATEFKNLWCECEQDIYSKIEQFVVLDDSHENIE